MPRPRGLAGRDATARFLAEGYAFVSNVCREVGSDRFATRLLLQPVVCARGARAAAAFYAPGAFGRVGAMPPTTLRLLQDVGSVQTLEGAAHRRRKATFLRLAAAPAQVEALRDLYRAELARAADRWRVRGGATLFAELPGLFARSARRWAGLPDSVSDDSTLTVDLVAMIENSGRLGLGTAVALLRRRRLERRIETWVTALRDAPPAPDEGPAATMARETDEEGVPLPPDHAAVEILNLLRPVTAVARFAGFAALTLGRRPDLRARLATADDAAVDAFAEEVRRFHPFFPVVGGLAREAIEWDGHVFEPGDWMLLDLYGTDHDPAAHREPEAFDPDRGLSWRDSGFAFVPQGAGDPAETHRCPGEAMTVALIAETARFLSADLDWSLPPQDLTVDLRRIPATPRSGVEIAVGGRLPG